MARRPGKPEPKTPPGYSETTAKPESNDPRKKKGPGGPKPSGSVSNHPNSPMSRGY